MRNNVVFIIVILSTSIWSCGLLGTLAPDDEMVKEKVEYDGTRIRLDGFYYSEDPINKNVFEVYYFFANGSCKIISLGYLSEDRFKDTLPKLEWKYINENKINNGAFWIKDSLGIEMQFWAPDNIRRRLFAQSIKILNDTILVKNKLWEVNATHDPQEFSDTFHFQKSLFKPDSSFFEKGFDKKR